MPSKRILIIDDDPTLPPILKAYLQTKGYAVATSADGFDGLSQIIIEDPDLIIVDALLPKMNGLQFMKRLRENETMRKIPVIMMSAKPNMKDFFSDFNIEEFLRKPFGMEDLLPKIEKLIGKPSHTEAASPKRVLIVTLDKFLKTKVAEYFKAAGWEVYFSDDHHDDAYNLAVSLYPDAILCHYWDEAWEGSALDTKTLANRLEENHLLAKIPFYVFCEGGAVKDAMQAFHEPQFIKYEKIADLLSSISKRLDIKTRHA